MPRPGKIGGTGARIAVPALAVFAGVCAIAARVHGSTVGAVCGGAIALVLAILSFRADARTMQEFGDWLSLWC